MAGGGAQLHRPVRPGEQLVFLFGRLRHDFDLPHARRALAIAGAHAVAAGIAAADDDYMLARGGKTAARRGASLVIAGIALVLLGEEFHREAHPAHFRAGNFERSRMLRPASQHDRVEILLEAFHRHIDADFGAGAECDAFGFHLHRAAIDQGLFHFEVGNAVTQQSAHPVRLFEHGHRMPGARQLLRAGEACGAGADHRHALARLPGRHLRLDPAFFPAAIDDGAFDAFDRHRLIGDVERAAGLARGGADTAGKFGEIVRRMKDFQRVLPVAFIDEMVPVRDDIVHRAAIMAVRDAAIHATRGLVFQPFLAVRNHEFAIMLQPLFGIVIAAILALDFEKACLFTHDFNSVLQRPSPWRGLGVQFTGVGYPRLTLSPPACGRGRGWALRHSAATEAASSRSASSCFSARA